MVKQRLSIGLVLLTATFAAANCDSGDTVVSVNVSYDSTAMDLQKTVPSLQIVVKPVQQVDAGEFVDRPGSPAMATVEIMHDDAGAITTAVYKRIAITGWSGWARVTVEARDGSGKAWLASTEVEVKEHGAAAAFVRFKAEVPDAGTVSDAAGDAADAGSGGATGSGGSDSASGGSSGSGGSGAGGAGGA